MRVTVRLYAGAKARAGNSELTVEVPEPVSVLALKQSLVTACPELGPLMPHSLIAVAAEYCRDADPIPEGAEVALIPPVSGGSKSQDSSSTDARR